MKELKKMFKQVEHGSAHQSVRAKIAATQSQVELLIDGLKIVAKRQKVNDKLRLKIVSSETPTGMSFQEHLDAIDRDLENLHRKVAKNADHEKELLNVYNSVVRGDGGGSYNCGRWSEKSIVRQIANQSVLAVGLGAGSH